GHEVPKRIDRKRMNDYRAQIARISMESFTADRVDEFLAALPPAKAARTRNGFRTSVLGLFNFLVKKRKTAYNPLLSVTRHEGEKKRKRRALPAHQLQALLDAAKARPLAQTLVIHRGGRKGLAEAHVSPEVRERRKRDGFQRALIYMTVFY